MIGYLDLSAGISGDMFLGCLVDAGWPIERLRAVLTALDLPPDDWSVNERMVMKGALRARLVDVRVKEGDGHHHHHDQHHAHDHHHDHGHDHHHGHDHAHEHAHDRAHAQTEAGQTHTHGPHRNLHDVRAIIEAAALPEIVRKRAVDVFVRLAHAEAKVHGSAVEAVHFHEVGALDAIVDIVGTVAGLYELGVTDLFASPVPLGGGWTMSAHGRIPLPAPATLELLTAAGAPTCAGPGDGELVTPTGAALVCELARFDRPQMRLERLGCGAGQRDCAWPNVARLSLGVAERQRPDHEVAVEIATNIDDMNPQFYAPLLEHLLTSGALDAWLTPVQMKKGRPGVVLTVLTTPAAESAVVNLLLRETTTLGVRRREVEKRGAEREMRSVETPFGAVPIKLKVWEGRVIGAQPEYEDCRRLADAAGVAVRVVHETAMAAAHGAFLEP